MNGYLRKIEAVLDFNLTFTSLTVIWMSNIQNKTVNSHIIAWISINEALS